MFFKNDLPKTNEYENGFNGLKDLRELLSKKIGENVTILAVVKLVEDLQKVTPKNKHPISLKNIFI